MRKKIVEGRNLSLIFCIRCQAINHITMIDSNEINETEEKRKENDTFFSYSISVAIVQWMWFWMNLLLPIIFKLLFNLLMFSYKYPSSCFHFVIFHSYNTQVACCGSEGPNDYLNLRQPLPIECRDTVTGHAFASGCVDELTWYLEDKSIWAAAMAMSLAMIHVSSLEPWNLLSKII